ncbi:hypothetical protein MMC13_002618 [Lambiella insularis]|nr:hypothetical protein [Lambiella insularis]
MPVPKSEFVSDVWREGIFANKVVFCTGGAGTICNAQVRALVHLGANACIVGRNVEKTESMAKDIATARNGAKVLGLGSVDVRSPESINAAVAKCVEQLGGIDYMIAGAAGNFLAPISQLSSNAFKSVIDIDVLGSYNTLKATMPHLIKAAASTRAKEKSGTAPNPPHNPELPSSSSPLLSNQHLTPTDSSSGRIIFISACLHYTGLPLQAHVCAAKAAIDALSATTAIELGPRGVTSNVISPGGITNTEGMERLSRNEDPDGAAKRNPMGRLGTTKDISDATVYLFSDAGNHVNGTILVVDGGGWRTMSGNPGSDFAYPDFLLSEEVVTGVKGMKGEKKANL